MITGYATNNATALGNGAIADVSDKIQLGNTNVTLVNTSGFYQGAGFKTPTGTSTQYLMADGSVSTGATGPAGPTGATGAQGPIGATGGYPVHYIGESYGGGIVFYVYDGGQHGLIAATTDQSTSIRWYGGSYTNTCAKGDGVGAGLKNTAIIIANQGPVDGVTFAARICNEYSVTVGSVTYGDWYLPSKHELNLLHSQKSVVGGFNNSANSYYCSSTEFDAYYAWSQLFANAFQYQFSGKAGLYYVRAVRAF